MTAVSGWDQAASEIRGRLRFPTLYTVEDADPPCPVACGKALFFIENVQLPEFRPAKVENGPNGGIHIGGEGWHMHFWEQESGVADG